MTDDLIARLRSVDVSWSETGEWCAEAADRIEALTAEVERLREALEESWALNVNYHAVEEPDGYQFTEAPAVIEMARAALEARHD